jgi:hypothetical protein
MGRAVGRATRGAFPVRADGRTDIPLSLSKMEIGRTSHNRSATLSSEGAPHRGAPAFFWVGKPTEGLSLNDSPGLIWSGSATAIWTPAGPPHLPLGKKFLTILVSECICDPHILVRGEVGLPVRFVSTCQFCHVAGRIVDLMLIVSAGNGGELGIKF